MGSLDELIFNILKENSKELANYWKGVSPISNSLGVNKDLVIATNFFNTELSHIKENRVQLDMFIFIGYSGNLTIWLDNFKKIVVPALVKHGFLSAKLDYLLTENF